VIASPLAFARGIFVAGLAMGGFLLRGDPIEDTARAMMAKRHIPALSLAVVADGAIVKAEAYGFRAPGQPATPETLFAAGSVSKPVTTLGALLLVRAGRLAMDDDVNRTLRGWNLPESQLTSEQKVTLRRLLSHTAGISGRSFQGYETSSAVPTLLQLLDGKGPTKSPPVRVELVPGSSFRYSGGGFLVVQQLLTEVAGEPFAALMQRTVFEPLHMTRSTFQQPLPVTWHGNVARGNADAWRAVPNGSRIYPELAAAGLWTTPSDLARMMIEVQTAYRGQKAAVLEPTLAREMLTAHAEDQGLGFALAGSGNTLRFLHGGRILGFDTQFVGYAGLGKGAVVMINANDASNAMAQVIDTIAEVYGWTDYPRLKPPPSIEDTDPKISTQVREVLTTAAAGKIARGLFTAPAFASLSERLRSGLAANLKGYGAIQSIALLGRSVRGEVQEFRYRVKCERETLRVICAIYRGQEIGQLDVWVE
jgi:CubicO group peptidase (beta-lactamase class C family)